MCTICKNLICPSGCPNSEQADERPICRCTLCDAPIYFGESALVLEDRVICESCAEEATVTVYSESDVIK